jgi:hypothetical protein
MVSHKSKLFMSLFAPGKAIASLRTALSKTDRRILPLLTTPGCFKHPAKAFVQERTACFRGPLCSFLYTNRENQRLLAYQGL